MPRGALEQQDGPHPQRTRHVAAAAAEVAAGARAQRGGEGAEVGRRQRRRRVQGVGAGGQGRDRALREGARAKGAVVAEGAGLLGVEAALGVEAVLGVEASLHHRRHLRSGKKRHSPAGVSRQVKTTCCMAGSAEHAGSAACAVAACSQPRQPQPPHLLVGRVLGSRPSLRLKRRRRGLQRRGKGLAAAGALLAGGVAPGVFLLGAGGGRRLGAELPRPARRGGAAAGHPAGGRRREGRGGGGQLDPSEAQGRPSDRSRGSHSSSRSSSSSGSAAPPARPGEGAVWGPAAPSSAAATHLASNLEEPSWLRSAAA